MSLSFGSSKSDTKSKQQNEPWKPTIPSLTSMIGDIDQLKQLVGPTGDQLDAFASLKNKAAAGNPWMTDINSTVSDTFDVNSRAPMVDDAYSRLQQQLGSVANGDNQDIMSDPRLAEMMRVVGDDVQNRIAGQFAGAGRDITGNAAGQGAIGRGVTAAQLPILVNEYARQQGRTDAAVRDLFGGGTSAATTAQGLDKDALGQRTAGIDLTSKALEQMNLPENSVLNLDQQLKNMPSGDLANVLSLLLPIAGTGGQSTGSSSTSGTSMGLGLKVLSDERVKEDIEEVGQMNDGTTIYRWRYIGDPTWHMGPMAQEVEQRNPEAVGETAGGLKTLDIKAATDASARKGSAY